MIVDAPAAAGKLAAPAEQAARIVDVARIPPTR
jgi:hypothetical protein